MKQTKRFHWAGGVNREQRTEVTPVKYASLVTVMPQINKKIGRFNRVKISLGPDGGISTTFQQAGIRCQN